MPKRDKFIEFPQAKGIVVSGDIHGDITPLVFKCCVQYSMTDTLIIVAGDCGFGFEKPGYYENVYKRCREKLSKANNWLVFIRGNHDNPAYYGVERNSANRCIINERFIFFLKILFLNLRTLKKIL